MRWLRRGAVVLVALVLLSPALLYVFMRIEAARSVPSDPAAVARGNQLARARGNVVMVVAAHPDDIDYWASGTMAKLHRNGNRIVVIVATAGERGANIAGIAEIRRREQRAAGAIVGYDRMVFLDHPDRGLKADERFKDELRHFFGLYQPDVLFTFDVERPDPTYQHVDHDAAGRAAIDVAAESTSSPSVYRFHTGAPDVSVDIADVAAIKSRALDAHDSVLGRSSGWRRLLAIYFWVEKNVVVGHPEVFRMTRTPRAPAER